LIDQARLQAGQRVFITGCLGGVGRVAVQIARMSGAEVAGSCSASRRDEALALGVQDIVDYRAFDPDKYRGRFDVVLDTHGSLSLSQCRRMLKRGGLALHIVPTPWKMVWSRLSSRHQTVFGAPTQQGMDRIVAAVDQGKITPAVGRVVTLSDAISAIVHLEKTGQPRGKLVVVPA
jgi:NADPH:quinone reductase-like Zn-dependent oxidoreductase